MRIFGLGAIGVVVGGVLGYMLSPQLGAFGFSMGRVPFIHALTRGALLGQWESLLLQDHVSMVNNRMLLGAFLCGALGAGVGAVWRAMSRKNQVGHARTPSPVPSSREATPLTGPPTSRVTDASLAARVTCRTCDRPVTPTQKFCGSCGAALRPPVELG